MGGRYVCYFGCRRTYHKSRRHQYFRHLLESHPEEQVRGWGINWNYLQEECAGGNGQEQREMADASMSEMGGETESESVSIKSDQIEFQVQEQEPQVSAISLSALHRDTVYIYMFNLTIIIEKPNTAGYHLIYLLSI